jgi:fucose 4-O-acetylase-like acetyltransferase
MRNPLLDFSRGILIFLVVLGHTVQYSGYSNIGFWNDPIFLTIYMFHMPMFVFISGYLTPFHNKLSFFDTAIRCFRLLTPLFCWTGLYVGAKLFILEFEIISISQFLAVAIVSLWYLWALAGIAVIFYLTQLGHYIFRILTLFGVISAMISLHGSWFFSEIFYLLPFFLLGSVSARIDLHQKVLSFPLYVWAFLGVASILCYVSFTPIVYIYQSKYLAFDFGIYTFRFVTGLVMSMLFVRVCCYLIEVSPSGASRIQDIGNHTLVIYILSSLIQPKILGVFNANSVAGIILAVGLSIFLTIGFYCFSRILGKFRVTRVLLLGAKK